MSSRSLALTLVAALCALFGFSTTASAAPSDLDKAFGNGGIVLPNFNSFVVPTGSVVQPDGKLLIGGSSFGTPTARNQQQLVARFNPDGSLDPSFGTGGITLINYEVPPTNGDYGSSITLQADGRIVLTGAAGGDDDSDDGQDSTVTRLLSNGAPDPGFGDFSNGKLRIAMGDSGKADFALEAIAGDANELFVGGTAYRTTDDDSYLLKLDAAGLPESDFGSGGVRYRDYPVGGGANKDSAVDLVRLANGNVVLLSKCDTATDDDCAVVESFDDTTGSTDGGFGVGGTYKFSIGEYPGLFGLILQSTGRIVVGYNPESSESLRLRALLPDGSAPDTSFGIGGESDVALPDSDLKLEEIIRTSDDGFLAVGRRQTNPGGGVFVRATASGAGLSTFGTGGVLTVPGTPGLTLTSAAVQADGRYLGIGYNDAFGGNALVRLIGDGPEPPAPPAPIALTTKIKSPSKSKMKASKLKSIAGTAAGTGLVKVKLAIQKIDSKLLKKSKRCLFVTSSKGKTKKYKSVKKRCSPTKYLTAKGTTNWSYKIKLKPGKYKLFLVGVGDGARVGKTTTKTLTLTK